MSDRPLPKNLRYATKKFSFWYERAPSGQPPSGNLASETLCQHLGTSGDYAHVWTETGAKGYVFADDLRFVPQFEVVSKSVEVSGAGSYRYIRSVGVRESATSVVIHDVHEIMHRLQRRTERYYVRYRGTADVSTSPLERAYLEVGISKNHYYHLRTIADGSPLNNLAGVPDAEPPSHHDRWEGEDTNFDGGDVSPEGPGGDVDGGGD